MNWIPRLSPGRLDGRALRLARDVWGFGRFAVRRFYADQMGMAAGALTYSTLLALVPLMVITFAILSGFPAFDSVRLRMEEVFLGTLVPEVGAEVETYLSEFSRNASNLTAIGIVALAVTAVLLLWTIEATLNRVWRVERQRPMGVRLLVFWAILTLGPLLLGASFAVTSDFATRAGAWGMTGASAPIETSSPIFRSLVAIVAQTTAFTLLYLLVPARPVRKRDALIGGALAGIAFQVLKWGFNSFLTSGSTYETIYGAVAVFPIFLVWVYSSWMVIIFGAVFAASFPDWWKTRDPLPETKLTPARRLEIAVALLAVLAQRARHGEVAEQSQLQDAAPLDGRDDVIEALHRTGYVVTTDDEHIALSRDLYATSVRELAHDLGLALGLPPPHEDPDDESGRQVLPILESTTGELPRLLHDLGEAEVSILDRPIAEVLTARGGADSALRPMKAARAGS